MINKITQLFKGTLTSLTYCYNIIVLREGIIAHNQGKGLDPSLVISHVLTLCTTISAILIFIFEIQSYSAVLSVSLLSMSLFMLNAYLKSGTIPSFWPILLDSIGQLNIPILSALAIQIAVNIRMHEPGMMANDSEEWEPPKTAPWSRYPLINKLLDNVLALLPNVMFYSFGALVAYNICLAYTTASITSDMISVVCFLVISELSYRQYLDDASKQAFLTLGQYALTALIFFNGAFSPAMHFALLITPGLYFTSAYRQLWKIGILLIFGQNHAFYANEMEYPKKPKEMSPKQRGEELINIAKNIDESKTFDPERSAYLKEKIVNYEKISNSVMLTFSQSVAKYNRQESYDNGERKQTAFSEKMPWLSGFLNTIETYFSNTVKIVLTIVSIVVSLITYYVLSLVHAIPYVNQLISDNFLKTRGSSYSRAKRFHIHNHAGPVADLCEAEDIDFKESLKQYALTDSLFSLKPSNLDHPLVKEYNIQECFEEMMEKLLDFESPCDNVSVEYVNEASAEMPLILVKQFLVKTYIRACGEDVVIALIEKWKTEDRSVEQMLSAGMLPDLLDECGFPKDKIDSFLRNLDVSDSDQSELRDPGRLGALVGHANLGKLKSNIGYMFSEVTKGIDAGDINASKNTMAKIINTKSACAAAYDGEINAVIAEHYQAHTLKDYIDNAIFEEKGRIFMQNYNYIFSMKESAMMDQRFNSFGVLYGQNLAQAFVKGNGSKADIHKVNAFASGFSGRYETKYTMNGQNDTANRSEPALSAFTGYFSPCYLEEIAKNDVESYLNAIIDSLTIDGKMSLLFQKVSEMEFSHSDYQKVFSLFKAQYGEGEQNYFTDIEAQEIKDLLDKLENDGNELPADQLEDLHDDLKFKLMLPWIQGDTANGRYVSRHGAYYVLIQVLLEEGYLAKWKDVKKPSVTGFIKKGLIQLLLSPIYDGFLLLKALLSLTSTLLLGVILSPRAINRHAAKNTKATGFLRLAIYTLLTPIVLAFIFLSTPSVAVVLPTMVITKQVVATFVLSWSFVAVVMGNTSSETVARVLNTLLFVALFAMATYASVLLIPALSYEVLSPYFVHLALYAPALYIIDSNMTHIILFALQQSVSYVATAACFVLKLPISIFAAGPTVKSGCITWAQFCTEVVEFSQEACCDAFQYAGRVFQDIMGDEKQTDNAWTL